MTENALNTDAFPSLRTHPAGRRRHRVRLAPRRAGGGRLHDHRRHREHPPRRAGRPRAGPGPSAGVRTPNVVLPTSAHAAFEKGAHYFGLENRRIPVREDWRADVDAMAAAIDDDTVLVVGSAPQYPQGVIDPDPPRSPRSPPSAASTATSTPAWAV